MYPYDCVISQVAARSRLLGSWSAWAVSFWLTSLWVTSLGLRLGGFVSAAETRPNILFILTDDTGWTALSCYGNRDVETPHLDRLASQGMRFTNA
ncbi:MAG: sulfatase-like hydrolase/transferase, partial [Pirellulaceae bacterium]